MPIDYKTVNDIAKAVGLSSQEINNYEKLGFIKPALINDDTILYYPVTIDRVKWVVELSKKHTLNEIKVILDKDDADEFFDSVDTLSNGDS